MKLANVTFNDLGRAKGVTITKAATTIVEAKARGLKPSCKRKKRGGKMRFMPRARP